MPARSIDVCVCTFRRESLTDTLASIEKQELPADVSLRIIVADNDAEPSAAARVGAFREQSEIPVRYIHAPARNISIARNACLDAATADWLAFIDDDEVAAPDWLALLLAQAEREDLTAVFGPAHARYDETAPEWITLKDFHTNQPERRGAIVETGHTCNALVRRTDPLVRGERFLREKGRSGGEDTEFFFRLYHKGARYGICQAARVFEKVEGKRLDYRWLLRRRFREGQSYGYHAAGDNNLKTVGIILLAGLKVIFSLLATLVFCWSEAERNYWSLRAVFHAGVVSSLFQVPEEQQY